MPFTADASHRDQDQIDRPLAGSSSSFVADVPSTRQRRSLPSTTSTCRGETKKEAFRKVGRGGHRERPGATERRFGVGEGPNHKKLYPEGSKKASTDNDRGASLCSAGGDFSRLTPRKSDLITHHPQPNLEIAPT